MNRFQYENEIRTLIQKDNNCSAHFEWDRVKHPDKGFTLRLNLITYNPLHSMHFLLHSISKIIDKSVIEDNDYEKILEEMHNYLSQRQVCLYNYVIKWRLKMGKESSTCSYFQGNNIKQIIDKFYYGKEEDTIIIDSIQLVPDS